MTYQQVPKYFTYAKGVWKSRLIVTAVEDWEGVSKANVVGGIYTISPHAIEVYHLMLLLLSRQGPTSFEDIGTVDGTIYPTHKEACNALGLLDNDRHMIP